jgi:predicted RNA methylase
MHRNLVGLLVTTIRRMYTVAYEKRYNIRTGFEKLRTGEDRRSELQPYEPTDYLLIHAFIRQLNPQPSDIVFDIGCGMGRVLCVFARMDIKKCIGIELSTELAEIAADNAERLHARKAPIEIRVADAGVADYSEGTIFWMFNPFGASVINAMLDQIEMSLVSSPRKIQIAYVNPVHQSVFRDRAWLTCIGRGSVWYSKKVVTYWGNR